MRDPNRLYDFYSRLQYIHQTHYPDLRFTQFVELINSYIKKEKDPFYVEDETYIRYAEELRRENAKFRHN